LFVGVVTIFSFAQFFSAQETVKDDFDRTLHVELDKSSYVMLEPMLAKFNLTLPSADRSPRILKSISVKITYNGRTRQFQGLTLITTQGEPQPLPAGNHDGLLNNGELDSLRKGNSNVQPTNVEIKSHDFDEEEIIDRVGEFFPNPGKYQIQFLLHYPTGKVIPSNVIEITVEEPSGIDKEAFDFLNKYENAISFFWVWKEKNGEALLAEFVNKYGGSLYGESAISYLGNVYLAKVDLDKAKAEFEKIKASENSTIARNATNSLTDIAKRKADLQKNQKENERPQ
jgi:hypothetical protein